MACERADSIEAMSCWAKSVAVKTAIVKTAEPAGPAKAATKPSTKKKADELVSVVVANFHKLATGRPRT